MGVALQSQGYYENGNYFFDEMPSIPSGRVRVTVIFHDDKDKCQQKMTTIKGILTDALKAENELTAADWEEMTNLRTQTNAGLKRTIEI